MAESYGWVIPSLPFQPDQPEIERGKEIVQRYNQYDTLLDALEQLIADIESTHVDGEELERSFYPPTMEQARAAVVAARGGDK